jgi:glycerol-3-phosphate dehydrogenase (NAD(P)+)
MAKITVVGAGSWGTAIGALAARRNEVVLWAREPEVADGINVNHENPLFLSGSALPASLSATNSIADALTGAEVVVLTVPSRFYRPVLHAARDNIPSGALLLSLTKGLEEVTLLRMTEVAAAELPHHPPGRIGVLSGPNIAHEVIDGQPGATVVAFADEDFARTVQALLMDDAFRIYTHTDVVGCEIGGSVKNVVALACGMAEGLGYGANSQAALVTRGLAELTRLGVAMGGDALTFLGLAGIGDLFATCTSPHSRNRTVGVELGRGRQLDDILSGMAMVAEGVQTAEPAVALATGAGVEMPVADQVVAVLRGRRTPADAVGMLMHRPGRSEHVPDVRRPPLVTIGPES